MAPGSWVILEVRVMLKLEMLSGVREHFTLHLQFPSVVLVVD